MRRIDLRSIAGGTSQPLALTPAGKTAGGEILFRGRLPQLVDSLEYEVHLGDAWTEPTRLDVIPLPIIEPKLTATPPDYARSAASSDADKMAGSRQIWVLEGSRVGLEIHCENKSLSGAEVTIDKHKFPLEKQDDDGHRWALSADATPLARIMAPVKYEIQVTDADGLHLPHPIDGYIRIKADRPPTVMASADVQYFLPKSGVPEIKYTVNDDHGVSALRMLVEVVHPGGAIDKSAHPIPLLAKKLTKPALKQSLPLKGAYRLPLDQFQLAKGDQVRLILEATDYRGAQPGKSAQGAPVVLQITDEGGIMAALSETDRHAYDQMNVLIQRQTQTGGLK